MLTGTNPSLFIAKEYIVKGYVPAEFAAQAISAIVPSVETPTKELLSSFYVRQSNLFKVLLIVFYYTIYFQNYTN